MAERIYFANDKITSENLEAFKEFVLQNSRKNKEFPEQKTSISPSFIIDPLKEKEAEAPALSVSPVYSGASVTGGKFPPACSPALSLRSGMNVPMVLSAFLSDLLSTASADFMEMLFSPADLIASSSVITGISAADRGSAAAIAIIMIFCSSLIKRPPSKVFFMDSCKSMYIKHFIIL